MTRLKGILLGDAMIGAGGFNTAWEKYLAPWGEVAYYGDWVTDFGELQHRRLEVEKNGPGIEPVEPLIIEHGQDANVLAGLFIAISKAVLETMPQLRLIGVSRAGLENVDVEEATKRGILIFNVMGRNAHAVSDFAVGMMLAEARNIARAHYAIKNGIWQKKFANDGYVPELGGKRVGLVGFGYIGSLVAKKLGGFDTELVVYDPYADPELLKSYGCTPMGLEELFATSDFVSIHARLTPETKGLVSRDLIARMKETAIFINTGRAGLVDYDALAEALAEKRIMGAALDVFVNEPIEEGSPFLDLDNVTLTTHIAGTTADALNNSPFLLMADVAKLLQGETPQFIVNPEVLDNPDFGAWLAEVQEN